MRFFNTEGPVRADLHCCIKPLGRVNLDEIPRPVWQDRCFVVHSPRQTGETSTLLALADGLNRSVEYRCVDMNVELGQLAREDLGAAKEPVLAEWSLRAGSTLQDDAVNRM